jgi:hypothetical protein
MSETLKNGHNQEGFETEDLSPAGIIFFMLGLAVVGILIYFVVVGMYKFLDAYDKNHEPPVNPMVHATNEDPRFPTKADALSFPEPRLEQNERGQLLSVVEQQDKILDSYDWVDQNNGIVRIPIDKAMELLAQRGLPVLPPGAAAQAASSAKKEVTAPKPKKAAPAN